MPAERHRVRSAIILAVLLAQCAAPTMCNPIPGSTAVQDADSNINEVLSHPTHSSFALHRLEPRVRSRAGSTSSSRGSENGNKDASKPDLAQFVSGGDVVNDGPPPDLLAENRPTMNQAALPRADAATSVIEIKAKQELLELSNRA